MKMVDVSHCVRASSVSYGFILRDWILVEAGQACVDGGCIVEDLSTECIVCCT